jgi:cell division septation protein DedD
VQLGAFGDENKAKNLWTKLEGSVSGLAGLQPYLVKAGGLTRLQAGPFETRAQADSMCGRIKASGNDCISKRR